jgi:DNA-binding beta-propeller fold protein YncE
MSAIRLAKLTGAAILSLFLSCSGAVASAQDQSGLKLVQTVELPGYTGDFDHFAYDGERGRLLLAAEDHATLEVFDVKTGKHLKTVPGFDAPHSILVRKGSPTIFVTDSGPSMSKLLDADTYTKKATVKLVEGADSIGYDAAANRVYVVTGGKDVKMTTAELAQVNPDDGKKTGAVKINAAHVEAMAIEKGGDRLFINLTDKNTLAIINRKTLQLVKQWPIAPAKQNAVIAFNEAAHRIFLICRDPGMLVVLNSDTGAVTNTLPAPLRVDEAPYDQAGKRLFVPGGEGWMAVYDVSDPDHVKLSAKVKTEAGAKTGLYVPELGKLYIAVSPGETKAMAKVLTYSVK